MNQFRILIIEIADGRILHVPIPADYDIGDGKIKSVSVTEPLNMPSDYSFGRMSDLVNSVENAETANT